MFISQAVLLINNNQIFIFEGSLQLNFNLFIENFSISLFFFKCNNSL